ncbi:MAG: ACP S-malonyltransferase [Actinomycetota bacterium]
MLPEGKLPISNRRSTTLVAWVFPGQGSQAVGMGGDLSSVAARATFHEAADVLGWDVRALCLEGPEERLGSTRFAQPALVTVEVAAARSLEARGQAPVLVAGHSVGEFSAAVVSGAISFEDALLAVTARAEAMARAGLSRPGGMAAVLGLEADRVEAICQGVNGEVGIANVNSPDQVVISGEDSALSEAAVKAKAEGARRIIRLRVSVAAHSPLMADARHALQEALGDVAFSPIRVPLVSGVTGAVHRSEDEVSELLVEGVMRPVRWLECVRSFAAEGIGTVIEVGPGSVLSGLVHRIDPELGAVQVEGDAAIDALVGELEHTGATR